MRPRRAPTLGAPIEACGELVGEVTSGRLSAARHDALGMVGSPMPAARSASAAAPLVVALSSRRRPLGSA
jgi:hypothetical protein